MEDNLTQQPTPQGEDTPAPQSKGEMQNADTQPTAARIASVRSWLQRISTAKKHWEQDFLRMQSNMDFTAGIQWPDQQSIESKRYVANLTLQVVNQKAAALYAKNPTVVAKRRPRMDFQIWDERNETLMQAQQVVIQAQQFAQAGPASAQAVQMNPMFVGANALLQDYTNGMMQRAQMDRVGKTLEIVYKYYCDAKSPDFKERMKNVVSRAVICNVGYVRQEFTREYINKPPTGTSDTLADSMQHAQMLMKDFQDGKFGEDDARYDAMMQTFTAMQTEMQAQQAAGPIPMEEKLVFLFPKPRSILPDERCTDFIGFENADWVAEEKVWKLSFINQYFEKSLNIGGGGGKDGETVKQAKKGGTQMVSIGEDVDNTRPKDPDVCVFEVYDKVSKTKFWLADGYHDFLQEPEAVMPLTRHFWPWFALVFNRVEVDESTKATAIGPSDVQQMKHSQLEWNRTREELREHRKMSAPNIFSKKGALTEKDKDRLMSAPTGAWIEIEAMIDGEKITDILAAKPTITIDPTVYDTGPLMQDVQMTTGQQETNLGARGSRKGETATAAAIAEQSRVSKSSSNVDDLDNLLGRLAENGAEILFYEAQIETVKRIAGVGAVWPVTPQARKQYADDVYLEVQAASSGRPNQQLEVANFERLAPLLLQMGGGSPQFLQMLVREGVKRMNDTLDLSEMVPVPLQNVSPQQPLAQDAAAVQSNNLNKPPGPTSNQGVHQNAPPQSQAGIQR